MLGLGINVPRRVAFGRRTTDPHRVLIDFTTNVNELDILTRDSAATYWGPEGSLLEAAVDEARIQHDPVTGEALGLLVEESRTNLTLASDTFSGGLRGAFGNFALAGITLNTEVAPDASTTADTLSFTGISDSRVFRYDVTPGATYSYSVYVKKNPTSAEVNNRLRMLISSGLDDSLVSAVAAREVIGTSLTDEWVRYSISYTVPSDGSVNQIEAGLTHDQSGACDYAVDVWGQQLEEGSYPTTYIPTNDSPITRAADNAVIDLSDVINPDEGTFFFEFMAYVGGGLHHYVNLNNSFRFFESASAGLVMFNWGASANILVGSGFSGPTEIKLALSYTGGQALLAVSLNDEISTYSADTNFLIDNTLYLFNRPQGDRAADGIFKTVEYYPETVPEEQLIQMVGGGS